MPTTPYMSLILPTDHNTPDTWGALLNAAFAGVDAHRHLPGEGRQVPSLGIGINADLTFASFAAKDIGAIDFAAIAASAVTGYAGALFMSDGTGGLVLNELYWRTVTGVNVKITDGISLNVSGFAGAIGGDYVSVGALLDYDDSTDTFRFRQELAAAVRQFAKVRFADIQLVEYDAAGDASVPANAVTIRSPDALASPYTLTWPAAVPASNAPLMVDNAGVITAPPAPTFTGLVTLALGATASVDQHFTVSGTGDYKHGDRELAIPGPAFMPASPTTSNVPGFGGSVWSFGAAPPNDMIFAPVWLRTGDRVKSITWFFDKNSNAVALTMTFETKNGTTITARDTLSDTSSGAAQISVTRSGINYTMASGDSGHLFVQSGNSVHQFSHAIIVYDRP